MCAFEGYGNGVNFIDSKTGFYEILYDCKDVNGKANQPNRFFKQNVKSNELYEVQYQVECSSLEKLHSMFFLRHYWGGRKKKTT